MDEAPPGRLAVWHLRQDDDALRLEIDLDPGLSATVTIDPDGRTTTELSGPFAAWMRAQQAA
jgi:hypothetical protein